MGKNSFKNILVKNKFSEWLPQRFGWIGMSQIFCFFQAWISLPREHSLKVDTIVTNKCLAMFRIILYTIFEIFLSLHIILVKFIHAVACNSIHHFYYCIIFHWVNKPQFIPCLLMGKKEHDVFQAGSISSDRSWKNMNLISFTIQETVLLLFQNRFL